MYSAYWPTLWECLLAFAGEGEDLMVILDSKTFLSILKSLGDPICMDVGSADGDNNNGNNGKGKRLVSDEEATMSEEKRSNMCNLYSYRQRFLHPFQSLILIKN